MRERLKRIFAEIPVCDVFADIGCDHGYISKAMLDANKCRVAVASDVSEKCLKKAENTLSEYIGKGRAVTVVSDGFDALPYADCALIAGMGGEETAAIIRKCRNLPDVLVMQPMKNLPELREKIVSVGYFIEKDYVFSAGGKFYDVIVAKKGKDVLSPDEKEFGRTNIINRSESFKKRLALRLDKINGILSEGTANAENSEKLEKEAERLKKYV